MKTLFYSLANSYCKPHTHWCWMYESLHTQKSSPLWKTIRLNLEMMYIHSHSANLCYFVLLEHIDVFLQKRSKGNDVCKAGTAQVISAFFISQWSESEDLQWQKFPSALIDCMKTLKGNLKVLQKHQKHSDTSRLQQKKNQWRKSFFLQNVRTSSYLGNAPEYVQVHLFDLKWTVKIKII